MLKRLLSELEGMDVHVIDDPETFGRKKFWRRWERARQFCLGSKHDNYLIIPDDVTDIDLDAIRTIAKENKGRIYTCNVINDGRESCWGRAIPKNRGHKYYVGEYMIKECNFFDCGGVTNRATLSRISIKRVSEHWHKTRTSSGVGIQITQQLRRYNAKMYQPTPSLCHHGDHESVMHPEERKKNPLVTKKKLKIVVGIATMPGREPYLKKTVASLFDQVDEVRVYHNGHRDVDYTDNAKFYFLQEYSEPIYYLTCDDDIIYPPTYVRDMIDGIERTGGIVTLHGRFLRRMGVSYYRGGHRAFRCSGHVNRDVKIHVGGSGVMAFRTDYFNPAAIYKDERKCMADLIVSLAAAKFKRRITVLAHKANYIQVQQIPRGQTIFDQHRGKDAIQSKVADQILQLHSRP